jgi:SH3-like domain-containing protein
MPRRKRRSKPGKRPARRPKPPPSTRWNLKKLKENSPVKLAEKNASETALAVPLIAGPATVAADNVNLRGQAGLQGEVVGHVKKGDTVTVLAEITLDKPKAGEPAQWAKISLPAGEKVWINSKYLDPASKVVTATKLNLRGGPGENYSVLGRDRKRHRRHGHHDQGSLDADRDPGQRLCLRLRQLVKAGSSRRQCSRAAPGGGG